MQPDMKVKHARDSFPVAHKLTYLGTGSLGPVSTIFDAALRRCTAEDLRAGRALQRRYENMQRATERLRGEIASLVNVAPSEIALTRNTTEALGAVIEALPWSPGDEAICTQLEHAALRDPLEALAHRRRLTLRVAQVPAEPATDLRWLTDLLTPHTRLVAFSAIAFTTGQLLPIASIGAAVRAHGAYTLLDAAQCAGALPLDIVELPIDYCALPLQKWLCGPEGFGALVARNDALAGLRADRVTHGWGMFEAAAAHLEWLRTRCGWAWIHERTAQLAARAHRGLAALPQARLLTPARHGGLVTFACPGRDTAKIAERLRAQQFVFRHLDELQAFRISTAFFNTEDEIDRFIAAVGACTSA
jgi:L-cysteine/cystine lyase